MFFNCDKALFPLSPFDMCECGCIPLILLFFYIKSLIAVKNLCTLIDGHIEEESYFILGLTLLCYI